MKHYCNKCLKAHDNDRAAVTCCPINARVPDGPLSTTLLPQGPNDKPVIGTKLDQSKPRWSLLPSGTISQVIAVLEYGAQKYSVGNWIGVPDAKTRYYDAAMRHIESWHGGENNDPESGLPHLAHTICCLLFLMWFEGKSVS